MPSSSLTNSPVENAYDTIVLAFDNDSRHRRAAFRIVQRVLALAEERGYKESAQFIHYFRSSTLRAPQLTKKWVYSLFEYVSPDEFKHLAKLTAQA